jgi:hypothetical protein
MIGQGLFEEKAKIDGPVSEWDFICLMLRSIYFGWIRPYYSMGIDATALLFYGDATQPTEIKIVHYRARSCLQTACTR